HPQKLDKATTHEEAGDTPSLPGSVVSCPVTGNASGWPASVTLLPSFGIRMTALVLICASRFAIVVGYDGITSAPIGADGRESGPKLLQNSSEWFPLRP